MSKDFDNIIQQAVEQMQDSPAKQLLAGALKRCVEQQETNIEELVAARQSGDLTQQEFAMEFERLKQIVLAEMLTLQIAAKGEVQRYVNQAFLLLIQI